MTILTIPLPEGDYARLERVAALRGKSVQALVYEWIDRLLPMTLPAHIAEDPLFTIEGHDGEANVNLSAHVDEILYGNVPI
ncbi:MAG: hypothetical protein KIH69_018625 [Anaerolineae bacterium]|nr:hypothetical protein [Anaerolineae bacterium]